VEHPPWGTVDEAHPSSPVMCTPLPRVDLRAQLMAGRPPMDHMERGLPSTAAAGSLPPWSRRNGGYSSVIKAA